MAQLNLKIVTPEREVKEELVDMVTVPSVDGELGILPHHANLMARLSAGELRMKSKGREEIMAIGGGFMQIVDNNLTILTDLAVEEKEIDEKAAEEARKRAQSALEQKLSDEEYVDTLAILEKSLAQLKVKRRHRTR